jgi:hypothetical protein
MQTSLNGIFLAFVANLPSQKQRGKRSLCASELNWAQTLPSPAWIGGLKKRATGSKTGLA